MRKKQTISPEIEYLSKYKWKSPNGFNGSDAVFASLLAVIGMFLLGLAVSPLFKFMGKLGVPVGALMCFSAIITEVFIFLIALLFYKKRSIDLFGGGGLTLKFEFTPCLPALLLMLGTFFFIIPLHTLFAEQMDMVQRYVVGDSLLESLEIQFTTSDIPYILFYSYVLAPVLPAICEEILFRGVVMNGLREYGSLTAIFVSGLLFALMHGNYAQIILQFIIGCEIAFVVLTTGNYFTGIVMHFANNLFASFYGVISGLLTEISPFLSMFIESLFILVGMGFICVAICYYVKLQKFKSVKSDEKGKFPFYKEEDKSWCCLLEKGCAVSCYFTAEERSVLNSDNSDMLYFYNGKFRKFNKKSDKIFFALILGCALVLSIALIVSDFI